MKISVILTNNKYLAKLYTAAIYLIVKVTRTIRTFLSHSSSDIILIIAFRRIGDSVFTIPALKALKQSSGKPIIIFCFSETRPIFERLFKAETIISFGSDDFIFNRRAAKKIIRKKLSELNPCIIYDFAGSTISASLLFNSSARVIAGFNETYYKPIYTLYHPRRLKPHLMDMYLEVISDDHSIPGELLKSFNVGINKDGYILIHPFAGWKAKEWNLYKFIKLADKLNKKYRVFLLAEQGKFTDEIKNEISYTGIGIIESNNISELMGVIEHCSVMISNDSGPLYIASLLGKPTFTIYGPTNPDYSLPYGEMHRYVQIRINCSPEKDEQYCFTNAGRRNCPSFECMNLLQFDYVYLKVQAFLDLVDIKKIKLQEKF